MAYIHESALKKAVKMLHMLGSSDRPKGGKSAMGDAGEELGSMAGGAFNRSRMAAAAAKDKAKASEEARYKEAIGVRDAQVEGNQKWSEFTEKYGDRASNTYGQGMHDFNEIHKRVANNETAENTRMGGQYTPNGLVLAESDANKNAEDRLRARSMIQSQMQMQPPGMIGIGGTRRGY